MNDGMVGRKNAVPTGANSSFTSAAAANWATPQDEALALAKAHKSIHGFPSLQAAAGDLLDNKGMTIAPDVRRELKRLRDDPRQEMASEIQIVMAEQNLPHAEARRRVALRHPQLAERVHRFYAADGVQILEDLRLAGDRGLLEDGVPAEPLPSGKTKGARTRRAAERKHIAEALKVAPDAPSGEFAAALLGLLGPDEDDDYRDPVVEMTERIDRRLRETPTLSHGEALAQIRAADPQLSERLGRHYDRFNQSTRPQAPTRDRQLGEQTTEGPRAALTRLTQARAERKGIAFAAALREMAEDQPELYIAAMAEYPGA